MRPQSHSVLRVDYSARELTIECGVHLAILDERADWLLARTVDGRMGWVAGVVQPLPLGPDAVARPSADANVVHVATGNRGILGIFNGVTVFASGYGSAVGR